MREDVFEELLESVRQGGQILRGERKPGRVFAAAEPNARKIPHSRTNTSPFPSDAGIVAVAESRTVTGGRGSLVSAKR